MNHISIEFLAANKITVIIPENAGEKSIGYLLSNTGVNLEEFSLLPGINNITIKTKKRADYVFRVETTNEVAVKQVYLGIVD